MASKYWIKLYHEILDDPKMGMLSPELWRFTVELFLLAGETDCNGTLPNVTKIAWRLRYNVTQIETWLNQLAAETGIVTLVEDSWIVSNFAKRQAASDVNERVKRFRERKKQEESTKKEEANGNEPLPISNEKLHQIQIQNHSLSHNEAEEILKQQKPFALKLVEVCGYAGPEFVVNGKKTECAQSVLQLTEWQATIEQLGRFPDYWWGDFAPTFKQVVDNWGKFLGWLTNPPKPKSEKNRPPVSTPKPRASPPIDDALLLTLQQQAKGI